MFGVMNYHFKLFLPAVISLYPYQLGVFVSESGLDSSTGQGTYPGRGFKTQFESTTAVKDW